MTTSRTTLLSSLFCLTFAAVASAAHPQPLLHQPGGYGPLPKFGFDSYNVSGYGEVLTHVRYGGRAAQMGLEPGDVILRLNDFPLDYHGSWRDALAQAVYNGGFVRLTIRDVHTGHIAYRQTYLPGCNIGPITPKSHVVNFGNQYDDHCHVGPGYPGPIVGPITPKSKHYNGNGGNLKFKNNFDNVKKLVHKFQKKD